MEFVAVCHNPTENTTVVLELNQRQFSIYAQKFPM